MRRRSTMTRKGTSQYLGVKKKRPGQSRQILHRLPFVVVCLGVLILSVGAQGQSTSQINSSHGWAISSTPQIRPQPTATAYPAAWSNLQDTNMGERSEGREGGDEAAEETEGPEEIETDRDSFTPSTLTAPLGRLIAESSYSYIDNRRVADTHSYPELLLRYGVAKNMELRLGWNYEVGGGSSILSGIVESAPMGLGDELEKESRLLVGTKLFLSEQCGWIPQSAVVIQGLTPTSGESNLTSTTVTPVFGWNLSKNCVWDFATRFQSGGEEDDRFNVWSPSTVIKLSIGERSKAHIEYFSVFSDGRETETTQHFISPGIHYLLRPDFEIGWRAGWGLNDQSPNFFINFGIGRQF